MDCKGRITAAILFCLLALCSASDLKVQEDDGARIYNHTLARILAEYASAVYTSDLTELVTWTCSRCTDLTKGFKMTEVIVDIENCLQAYVGYAPDLNSIIVVFRGTQEHSIQNWIDDLFFKQLDLDYPGMPDAKVHHGFYSVYHNTTIRPSVTKAIHKTQKLHHGVPTLVVGHSLGGAMAAFCALDLVVNHGIRSEQVRLMTFGQPRVGNSVFAKYFTEYVPNTFRVTHAHDMVPHLPPYYSFFPEKTYHHFPREVWVHDVKSGTLIYSVEQICDDSGEDPNCCRSVLGDSMKDHVNYLGINMHAVTWNECRFVTDGISLRYETDPLGIVIISKDDVLLHNDQ